MFRKVVLAGIIAASCVLVGSPASAAPSYPCSDYQQRDGVSVKCSYGSYAVGIKCTMLAPLTGHTNVTSPVRRDGNWTKAVCPTGYYFEVGRNDYVFPVWDPQG